MWPGRFEEKYPWKKDGCAALGTQSDFWCTTAADPPLLQVYAVYHEHVDCVRQYACMLWSELDVVSMMAGTDEVSAWVVVVRAVTGNLMLGLLFC